MHTEKPCPDGSQDSELAHKINVGHKYIVLKEGTPEASLRRVSEWLNAEQNTAYALSEATLMKLAIEHAMSLIKASPLVNPQISIQVLASTIVSDCVARIPTNAIYSVCRWVIELGADKYPHEFIAFYDN